jgi:hypothetical protein
MRVDYRYSRGSCVASVLVSALFGALTASNAMADVVAFTPSSAPIDAKAANDPVNLGLVFTADSTFSVDALGIYDQADLKSSETVALYSSTGKLLTSATVTLSDPEVSGYLFQSITPYTLTAGDKYTLVAYVGDNDWSYGSTAPTTNADVTYDSHDYDYTSHLAFPTDTAGAAGGPNGTYYGPSFEIATAKTPEPGALILLATMLIALGGTLMKLRFFS